MSVPDIQNALELLRQRDVDAAISSLKEKVEEIPAHLTAHVLLARAYEAKRDWTLALRSWENAHFLMPNSPIVTAGKERVLERINEEEDAAPAPSDPSPAPPASRGDASPSTEPPEPQAPVSPAPPESREPQETAPTGQEDTTARAMDAAEATDAAEDNTQGDTPGEDRSDKPNPIAQQAQALLHGTQTAESNPDTPSPDTPDTDTPKQRTEKEEPQQADTQQDETQDETPRAQTSADASATEGTASEDSPSEGKASQDSTSQDTASQDTASQDSTAQDTAPPEHPQRIVGQFADTGEEDSSAEIETSRPDTTSYRPDTAIIDAAASLLRRGPTPASRDAADDANDQRAESAAPSESTSQAQGTAQGEARNREADERDKDSSGNLTPEGEADAFIPDFAARSTSSEAEESAPHESSQESSEQETSETGDSPTAETATQETDADAAERERSQAASYDTYDMPESRLLDELGPPPDARPLRGKEQGEEPEDEQKSATGREGTPRPDAPSRSSADESKGSAAAGDGTDGLSELEKLRRSAEQEARQGGARPGLRQQLEQPSSEQASSGKTDDTIGDLDQLIQDLESARIQPRPDLDELPAPNLEDDVEDLVSETLARIYAAQSQYREAARIYVKLASQEPANARDHLENAADMRKKAEKKKAEERAAKASGDE